MGRILAFDIGRKRTGVAVTDPLKIIANGLTTIPTDSVVDFLQQYIDKENVELIVIGQPKHGNNQPSEAVKYIQPVVNRIRKVFPDLKIEQVDERFTSKMAFQTMIDGGLKQKDRQNKALVDTISATIILQSFMESRGFNKF
ncbi:MAG TPA: Holliday junction resolvase RuvX [Bacteroidales bacterium]|nr:Holliday junction resolvase RuvX [Bacteroidales bacterium]